MDHTPSSPLVAPPSRTYRDESLSLLRLGGPLVGANLLQMSIAAIDVMFVARLGEHDLAAATLGTYLFNFLSWALVGLGSAAAPLIAAELGRRAHAVREVRRSFRMAMWVGLLGSVPVMLMMWQGEGLLRLLGQDADLAHRAGRFMLFLLPAVPLAIAGGIMRTAAAALGRPGWAFIVTGLALVIDIVANWAFVFGHGVPAMGLVGSALANTLSFAAMAAAYAVIFVADRHLRRYRLFGRWWRLEGPRIRDVFRIGLPIMAIWMLEGGLFGGAALLMGLIGVAEVAAHAIALNIAAFAFQLPFGIGQAATVRVGLAYGARDPAWVGRAGNVAILLGIAVMAVTAAIMWIAPRLLVSAYVDIDDPANAAVVALSVRFLALAALFQLADGAQAVTASVLRGLQDTRIPMFIALFGYWAVGFCVSIGLGFFTPLGGVGVWCGLAIGLLVVAALLGVRWRGREGLGLLVPR